MPNCIILRGLPGSGKSTMAKMLSCDGIIPIVSADNFFYHKGQYLFDRDRLGDAHLQCLNDFNHCLNFGYQVIVDNTNTTKKEYQKYIDYAKAKGYSTTILTVETDLTDEELAKRNVHGVPVETIRRMRERMHDR